MIESIRGLSFGQSLRTGPSFGEYDQCLAIHGQLIEDDIEVKGKFCFAIITKLDGGANHSTIPGNAQTLNGICIPSVCTQTEVTELFKQGKHCGLNEPLFNKLISFQ